MPLTAGSGTMDASILCGKPQMTNTEYGLDPMNGKTRRLVGWRIAAWTGAGLVLLIPLIAMRFTAEVRWTGFDFAVAGLMLAALVGAFELAVRLSGDGGYRAGAAVTAVAAFLMVWAQGAVSLVGSETDLSGLLFLMPLAVGAVGVLAARFRARGLSRTLWVMAGVQIITAAVGFVVTRDADAVLPGFWVAAWAVSAILFDRSARKAARS